MTDEEQVRKLEWIARLNAEELRGWHGYVKNSRPYFEGEQPAIYRRAKQLKITLE